MGRRGSDLVRAQYSWPKIAEQTIAAYRRAGVNAGSHIARATSADPVQPSSPSRCEGSPS
jgi:hypothetical protein